MAWQAQRGDESAALFGACQIAHFCNVGAADQGLATGAGTRNSVLVASGESISMNSSVKRC
jgi:hypothetical protein